MLDDLISSLKADGIEELVMIGGIEIKPMLFQGIALDVRFKGSPGRVERP